MKELEEKSIQILDKSVNIHVYGDSAVASGKIITLEPAYELLEEETYVNECN